MKKLKEKNPRNNKLSNYKYLYQNDQDNEYENEPINLTENYISYYKKKHLKIKKNKCSCVKIFFLILVLLIIIFTIMFTIYHHYINKNDLKLPKEKDTNGKIGVAFVFYAIFGNGIGRMLSLLCNELVKIEKYDIYLITGQGSSYDFHFDERVKIQRIVDNFTLIEKYDKTSNIKIYVLQNELTPSKVEWYQSLNGGKKVIGIMHGVYLSSIFSNQTGVYALWKNNQYFDAFVNVIADDYYVNKRLGITNSFFIPNLYTFDSSQTPNSNLEYHNLMIMGRESDKIKGGLYGIKAMDLIRKEVPDAKLYFISADYTIDYLENLIKELNLTNNIEILHYTQNISHYFLNSSILLCPSLSESFPQVMNEGKAHGLPIVAFNVTYSPPYQNGVILVENMNYTQMAEEAVKLLKDYNYRKIKGLESKLSLNKFSNKETVDKWDRLFTVLMNNDPVEYKKLQDYTFENYYDEEKARSHLETNWNMGKIYNRVFCCHDFNDMLKLDYINNIKNCEDLSKCK